jgi:hypothetical protein
LRRPLLFALVAVIPLLLYSRTARFGFVRADDEDLIARNQAFLSVIENVPRAFEHSYFDIAGQPTGQKTYYRPLTIVSFMLDARRGGAEPRPYHVTNVALHAAATCLLLALALAWGANEWAACAAALLFAVHPLNVQAVAWIAGRNDLLVAVFGLLSLLAFTGPIGATRATAHVVAFAAALFSKESGAVFPLIAVLHECLVRRRRLTRTQAAALACDALVVLAWRLARGRALGGAASDLSVDAIRVAVANLPQVLVHAGKMVVPVRLNVSPGVDAIGIVLGVIAIAAFVVMARSIGSRLGALGAIWILAFLLPTLVVPGLPVYEHRAYLPLMGVLITLALATGDRTSRTAAPRIGFVLIAGLLAVVAHRREEVFRDPFAYWTDGTRDARFGPLAHVNLGQLYEAVGRSADARVEYLRALERNPDTPKAHNNLGVVLMNLGEPERAREHFRIETERHPMNPDGWFNLGLSSEERGDLAEAQRYYLRAIAVDPTHAPSREKLAR